MSSHSRPPVTLLEYERLFRTIHTVIENEGGDPSKACLFFAIAGAYLLSRHHRLTNARPVAGIAGYNLRTLTNLFIVLGTIENGKLLSNEDNFHCWIEIDGWIIDLTAPLFDDMAPIDRKGATISRFMFQKQMLGNVDAFEGLSIPGAYMHVPNDELTEKLMEHFAKKPAHSDLVNICEQWYVRPPKKMQPFIRIGDQPDKLKDVHLSRIRITGAW